MSAKFIKFCIFTFLQKSGTCKGEPCFQIVNMRSVPRLTAVFA